MSRQTARHFVSAAELQEVVVILVVNKGTLHGIARLLGHSQVFEERALPVADMGVVSAEAMPGTIELPPATNVEVQTIMPAIVKLKR